MLTREVKLRRNSASFKARWPVPTTPTSLSVISKPSQIGQPNQAFLQSLRVQVVRHRRTMVDNAGGEQHGARLDEFAIRHCNETVPIPFQGRHLGDPKLCSIAFGLEPHLSHEIAPGYAFRITGVVVGDRDGRRAALTVVQYDHGQMEACQVNGGGEPCRPTADDYAIIIHCG